MDRSNLAALAVLVSVVGFVVGRFDAKAHGSSNSLAAAPALPEEASVAQAPVADARPEPPPPAPPAPAPSAPANPAPRAASLLDSQSDEGAGKSADLDKIGSSPKTGSPFLGPKDALVVVNVFSDFQCPVCRRSADPIKQLVLDFPDKVKVVFRNNALEMHGRALPAAIAAAAAGRQGKFWQYHDKLFGSGALDDNSLRQHARELGLDMAQFEKDLVDPTLKERVQLESKWSEQMGASGTPAFFVNGVRQVGWGSYLALKSMVSREIDKGQELLSAGTAKGQVLAKRIAALADKNHKGNGEGTIDVGLWQKLLLND